MHTDKHTRCMKFTETENSSTLTAGVAAVKHWDGLKLYSGQQQTDRPVGELQTQHVTVVQDVPSLAGNRHTLHRDVQQMRPVGVVEGKNMYVHVSVTMVHFKIEI